MCHFSGRWGKLQNSVQLQWHPRHLSSPNYPVMISSFKNRVYFESWALTELPGADRDDDTWHQNPCCGVSVRGWESQQIDKTCSFWDQVSTWAKRSWEKSIKTLSGEAILMKSLFLLQAEMTQDVRAWSFLKKLLPTYSENLGRKRREWRTMCPWA